MRKTILLVVVTAMLLGSLPATAQTEPTLACGSWVPSAGFTDVDRNNPHARNIDCISFWGITGQQGTFNPKGQVNRWQMALFMNKTFQVSISFDDDLPGHPFLDISSLPVNYRTAITNMSALGITSGIGNNNYGPNHLVTREQMAVFLANLLYSTGMDLPSGVDQGFTDIASLRPNVQTAINQMRQFGITSGVDNNKYGPGLVVTREQMATFLARTLELSYRLGTAGSNDFYCEPPLPGDGSPPPPGTVCYSQTFEFADTTFRYRNWWLIRKNSSQTDVVGFDRGTDTALEIDGNPTTFFLKVRDLPGVYIKYWEATVPGGLSGRHIITSKYFKDGTLEITHHLTVDFN